MKKILFCLMFITLSFVFIGCEPTTAEATIITNLTTQTTSGTQIDLEYIGLYFDKNEVCQGTIVTLNPFFTPTNASNQNYTITFSEQNVVQFVAGSNNLQIEVIGEPSNLDQGTVGFIYVTITSDFDSSINNQEQLYIYAIGIQSPQCQP